MSVSGESVGTPGGRVESERQNLNDLADFVARMPLLHDADRYRATILDTIRAWSVSRDTFLALNPLDACRDCGEHHDWAAVCAVRCAWKSTPHEPHNWQMPLVDHYGTAYCDGSPIEVPGLPSLAKLARSRDLAVRAELRADLWEGRHQRLVEALEELVVGNRPLAATAEESS